MILPLVDLAALAWFLLMWIGYDRFADYWSQSHASLLRHVNEARRDWMLRLTYRENRIPDVALMANLSSSPTFFASTTIIIIGGLFALLGSTSKVVNVIQEIPFSAHVPEEVWNVKIIVLICVFVFAFFRFTWALRQFNFCSILIGAAPNVADYRDGADADRDDFANRSGKLVALAGESFNDGLRGFYFAIAAMTWFVQPAIFMMATTVVVAVLYFREFHSSALHAIIGR
ncbi:MAG: DUF599 family protein [Proteobacteria bacterium]|nr:MAG: DUF599 family protein [Pseudomonadota bacterium]